jgi:hypothetical protein
MRTLRLAPIVFLVVPALLRAADDPVEVEPCDDTWLSSEHTGRPAGRGEAPEMQIYGKTTNLTNRALLKFNLKSVPGGVRCAILRMTCYNAHYPVNASTFLRAHPITTQWDQENASWDMRLGKGTWNHPGGDFDAKGVSGSLVMGPLGGARDRTYDFELTGLVQQWQAQPNMNQGVAIMLEKGCTAEMRFRSKEFDNAAARPKLLLYYQKTPMKDAFILPPSGVPPYEPYDPAAPDVQLNNKPSLKIGEDVSVKFSASGAKDPYVFSLASSFVPGLSLAPDGTVTGKPTKAGVFVFGVNCVAGNGKRGSNWCRWAVIDPNEKPPVAAKKDDDKPPVKPPDKDTKPPDKKPVAPVEE